MRGPYADTSAVIVLPTRWLGANQKKNNRTKKNGQKKKQDTRGIRSTRFGPRGGRLPEADAFPLSSAINSDLFRSHHPSRETPSVSDWLGDS